MEKNCTRLNSHWEVALSDMYFLGKMGISLLRLMFKILPTNVVSLLMQNPISIYSALRLQEASIY